MKTALYRKYRPTTFDGVIGQDVIVTTLTNQIRKGAVSHAYLFTGSRGTGKTSCAKIFARAVNCLSPVNGSPCGKCEVCRALASPSNLDIVEMDAASNNGVDKIRDLRESVGYLPAAGKYKVYIIDEVHMLSGSAFNALLKTLEEPPAHVVFVLCTTEVHKLPATILSRCMRFDFRLVATDKLFALVKDIFAKEGVKAEDKAIMHIARLGEGSVRDTLSIADRCMSAADTLTYELVLDITGAGSGEETAELLEAVLKSDAGAVITRVEKLAAAGKSVSQISRELTVYARDLILLMTSGESGPTASAETLARMKGLAALTSAPFLVRFIRTLGGADAEIRYSSAPRIVLESALLSLCAGMSAPERAAETPVASPVIAPVRESAPQAAPAAHEAVAPREAAARPAAPRPEPKKRDPEEILMRTPCDDKTLGVLGYIRQKLRKNGHLRIFGEYSELKDNRTRLYGNEFYVFANSGSYLTFAEPESMKIVQGILDELGAGYKLRVEKPGTEGADVLEQILAATEGLDVEVVDGKGKRITGR